MRGWGNNGTGISMNKHITENLNHYITLPKPEYAVLLSGKWGSGKTYFIDKFVDDFLENYKTGKEENKTKFLKITLFGLNRVSQIDEVIFQKLHPVLGHKYAKMTGGMLKSALKIGLNFDTGGNGEPEGRLTIDPKEFSFFSDDKKSDKELIFIFDDLERTNIELSEVLGYINYLVEQSGFKVIILANEEEIENKDKFDKFKEKIIGKTFEVKQDLDATFDTFTDMVGDSKKVLKNNLVLIKNIFKIAGYNNLRHIRQTILDFEYFYNQLDEKFQEHEEVMKHLINEFFIFSIEIKSGFLNSRNFQIFDGYLDMLTEKTKEKEEPTEIVFKKYLLVNEYNILLSIAMWKEILLGGDVKKEVIEETLNNSKYFIDEETEPWRRLWNYRDLEDNEFKGYMEEVLEILNQNTYKEQGKLLHVIALLLYFSKSKMIKDTQKDIMTKAKENIILCISSEKWDTIAYDKWHGASAHGLGFFERESKSMQNILNYFEREIKKSFSTQLKDKANELLEDFKNNNIENLEKKLQAEFNTVPIFNQVSIDDFVKVIQELQHKNMYDIEHIIMERYERNYYLENILSEEKFWKSVNSRILKGIDINDKPVKYALLKYFKSHIIKEILEKFKEGRNRLKIIKEQQSKST